MFDTRRALMTPALLGFLLPGMAPWATAGDEQAIQDWQLQMLLKPTPVQLQMEQQKDRVFIYSRVKDSDIDRAMDQQFGRIEHMMFVKTLVTKKAEPAHDKASDSKSSEPVVVESDDGC
jgi:hypothetical protein